MTGSDHWAPLPDQLKVLGFNAADVTKVVIGHAHWDHAGQLSDLPNAVLYVQREEDRKSTRLNSSHANISYAVFCLKKKKKNHSTNVIITTIICHTIMSTT